MKEIQFSLYYSCRDLQKEQQLVKQRGLVGGSGVTIWGGITKVRRKQNLSQEN